MPVTPQLLHELHAEEWGRVLLALTGITPVKTKAFHLLGAEVGGANTVAASLHMDAGSIVTGAHLFLIAGFNGSTGNAFSLSAAAIGDIGFGTDFATCTDVGTVPDQPGGPALQELPLTTFAAAYSTVNWNLFAVYTGTGDIATSGELVAVVEYASVDFTT